MTDEEKFIQSLYDEANESLKQIYKVEKESRDALLQEIALIMLTYTVSKDLMSLTKKDKTKEYSKLSNIVLKAAKSNSKVQDGVLTEVLTDVVTKTFDFYNYNANLKEVKEIIERNFKGKHFSERVWDNEKQVAKHLHKKANDFLNGKINVNQIKKDIEKTFNASAYNTKRLVETEVNRCSSNAFDRFCKEVEVKKVRYNATLDSKLCEDCAQFHDKVFDFDKKIEVPRHPLCRCFYTIEDVSILDKTDYMANRFIPTFGEEKEVKLGSLLISEKKVSNSSFNMWTDLDATSKNKAVRLYEKKIHSIIKTLPEGFELPKISIIDFEKVGLKRNAIGGYRRELNTIFINSKYNTDAKILKYLKENQGYFASVESNSPLLHELGHKFHYDLVELIANQKNMSYNSAKEIFDRQISEYILNKSSLPRNFITEQLSKYASDEFDGPDRINEIMAEYFSIKDSNTKTEFVEFIESYISEVMKK